MTLAECQEIPGCADLDEIVLADMIDVACELLWALSGRQFSGVCTDVVRPSARRTHAWPPLPSWWVPNDGWGLCSCHGPCGCDGLHRISLGAYPLREITEVRVDGVVVDPTTYVIHDRRWLVRTDGSSWPATQDLTADPATAPSTFQVTFEWGQTPPLAGVLAARYLAAELAKAYSGLDNALPERIQNITRQGVSMVLLDPQEFLDKGRTGIFIVDLFLGAVNPNRLQRRPSVTSPDICKPVTRVATTPGS